MVTTLLKALIVHQPILGSVQSLFVEAVTSLHQELVMALFDYGLLKVRAECFSRYTTSHWYAKSIIKKPCLPRVNQKLTSFFLPSIFFLRAGWICEFFSFCKIWTVSGCRSWEGDLSFLFDLHLFRNLAIFAFSYSFQLHRLKGMLNFKIELRKWI